MLKSRYRSLTNTRIQALFDAPDHVYSDSYFRILVQKKDDPGSQFVVMISQKTLPKAVKRNELRRQVFSDLETLFSGWTLPVRVGILVKHPYLKKSRSERIHHLYRALKSLHLC